MRLASLLFLVFALSCIACSAADTQKVTAAELAEILRGAPFDQTNVTLNAIVTRAVLTRSARLENKDILVEDETGNVTLKLDESQNIAAFQPGLRARFDCCIATVPDGRQEVIVRAVKKIEETKPSIPRVPLADILAGLYDSRLVQLTATVQDAFVDEIDRRISFLVLQQDGESLFAAAGITQIPEASLASYVGSVISIVGRVDAGAPTNRRFKGRSLSLDLKKHPIVVLQQAAAEELAAPDISTLANVTPLKMHAHGRRSACGQVVAAWHGDTFLLRTDGSGFVTVESATARLPAVGSTVRAIGFPETNLYHINLYRAVWQPDEGIVPAAPPTKDVSLRELFTDSRGQSIMKPQYHGQPIRLSGVVRCLPSPTSENLILIESDGLTLKIDISACPDALHGVELGSEISVCGIAVVEVETLRPNAAIPHVRGLTLVMRPTDRLAILARPSWWTPRHVWTVLGGLITLLVAVLIWNFLLRHLAESRGKELLKGEIESVRSQLQVEERTRLAVELHDALSQTLAGVSMEIATANALRANAPQPMVEHLGRANRILKSCREELRNCLWDLRSAALDEPDMTQAILRTLEPQGNLAKLNVRFNVPRAHLPDNTAHALLSIVRELVVNALRHGHATRIHVAGSLEPTLLRFSVTDNGSGFDVGNHPGIEQGHFGLQGVTERLNHIGGHLAISSTPGKGTRVVGTIALRNGLSQENPKTQNRI